MQRCESVSDYRASKSFKDFLNSAIIASTLRTPTLRPDDSLVFLKASCFDQTDIAISGLCNTGMSEGTHLIIAGTTGNARNWEKAGYACEYGNRERVSGKIIVQVDCIKIPPRGDD